MRFSIHELARDINTLRTLFVNNIDNILQTSDVAGAKIPKSVIFRFLPYGVASGALFFAPL